MRAGGGTATLPVSAQVLVPLLPAGELLELSEAVIRVFHRLGDRVHRQANRMKFLVKKLGFEGFRDEVEAERARVRAEERRGSRSIPSAPGKSCRRRARARRRPGASEIAARVRAQHVKGPGVVPAVEPDLAPTPGALAAFERTNVRPQRQPGYVVVAVTLPLGDVTSAQLRALADLARAHGDGTVRLTREQDLARWVRRGGAGAHAGLAAAGLGLSGAGTAARVTSCPARRAASSR